MADPPPNTSRLREEHSVNPARGDLVQGRHGGARQAADDNDRDRRRECALTQSDIAGRGRYSLLIAKMQGIFLFRPQNRLGGGDYSKSDQWVDEHSLTGFAGNSNSLLEPLSGN